MGLVYYFHMQYLGVIDGNNFFVSCERLFRPDLLGKPVVVLSSNDGCVVARSNEIKDMGIPMGVPYFQVKDILTAGHATVFSSHFTLYRDISARVFTEVRRRLPVMEQYSIDEAFFTFEAESVAEAVDQMRTVKNVLERLVGIPVSIGLAATKTQAKYANKLAKKAGGVVVLSPADWSTTTDALPLSDIWGVGGRLSRRYREAGMITVTDLLSCPAPRLQSLFGISGLRLQAELAGQVMYPVTTTTTQQKSIMSSRSFKNTTEDIQVVHDAVAYHVRHAAADLRRFGLGAQVLSVSIRPGRHGDYILRGGSAETVFTRATADSVELLRAALALTEHLFEPGVPYKKAGIVLSQLVSLDQIPLSLFDTPKRDSATNALMSVIDAVNAKGGREVIQLGRQSKTTQWMPRRAELSPAYTTRWSALATVQCR